MAKSVEQAATKFAQLMRGATQEGIEHNRLTDTAILTLVGIHPIKFQKGANLEIHTSLVVLPSGVGFDTDDIGKNFLFLRTDKGNKFIFLAELGVSNK
ncbi:MAG: hypothetical protein UEJ45_04630 [Peptococcaceae bacterium]|nr:hypothetical protein [Peptococcaceae bacterium]